MSDESFSELPPSQPVQRKPEPQTDLLRLGVIFQGALALIGIALGWGVGFCDRSQSLFDFDWLTVLHPALVWGLLGTVPLLAVLVAAHYFPFGPMQSIRQTVEENLYPLLKDCSMLDIVLLSLMAGVSEEILFRWCLQGGLAEVIPGDWAWLWALIIASVVFGLLHFINASYAILIVVVGLYLGWLMIESGTYLAPTIAHSLYDFIALYYVIHILPKHMDHQPTPDLP